MHIKPDSLLQNRLEISSSLPKSNGILSAREIRRNNRSAMLQYSINTAFVTSALSNPQSPFAINLNQGNSNFATPKHSAYSPISATFKNADNLPQRATATDVSDDISVLSLDDDDAKARQMIDKAIEFRWLKTALQYAKTSRLQASDKGLANLGNTCYMNAVLQCLLNIDVLACYYSHKLDELDSPLSCSFGKLAQQMRGSAGGSCSAVTPIELRKAVAVAIPQFGGYGQQDAHEFCRFFLDRLQEESCKPQYPRISDKVVDALSADDKQALRWNSFHWGNSNLISELFTGLYKSTVTCLVCKHESVTFDVFSDLSLPIPQRSIISSLRQSSLITLDDCFKEFTAQEVLKAEYMCEKCKSKQDASKKIDIAKCPISLVVQLKRFNQEVFSSSKKLSATVQVPLDWQISTISGSKEVYHLTGVCHHTGSLFGGHYFAHIKASDGTWIQKNDSVSNPVVNTSSLSSILSQDAYVLFYQKANINVLTAYPSL